MTAGRVRVNGQVVTELGSKVDPTCDVVTVDGIEYRLSDTPVYLVLNKPAGYLTTMSDPQGRHCVAELVPVDENPGLFPVGRLDADTTGALLFTTDGELANALLHPSHHVEKTYLALVEGTPSEAELDRLRAGITLDDGPCKPAEARLCGTIGVGGELSHFNMKVGQFTSDPNCPTSICHTCVELCISEGRKHQVKRMLEAIGHPVIQLHRAAFGPIAADGIKPGSYRMLDIDEIDALRSSAQEKEK